jgi:hypothetical protein
MGIQVNMRCSFCGKNFDDPGYVGPDGALFCSAGHQLSHAEREARASLGSLLLHVQASNAASRVASPFERAWELIERIRQGRPASYRSAARFLTPAAFPETLAIPQALEEWLPSKPGVRPLEPPVVARPADVESAIPFEVLAFAGPPPQYPAFDFLPLRNRYCFAEEEGT